MLLAVSVEVILTVKEIVYTMLLHEQRAVVRLSSLQGLCKPMADCHRLFNRRLARLCVLRLISSLPTPLSVVNKEAAATPVQTVSMCSLLL